MTTTEPQDAAPETTTDTEQAQGPTQDAPEADTDTTAAKGSREAAKYRTQLREAEAERDALREQLTTWRKEQAQTVAGKVLGDGSDLWRDGLDVADLLDAQGLIDPGKAEAAAYAVAKAHPTWAHRTAAPPKPNRLKSGASSGEEQGEVGWGKLLGAERRR